MRGDSIVVSTTGPEVEKSADDGSSSAVPLPHRRELVSVGFY